MSLHAMKRKLKKILKMKSMSNGSLVNVTKKHLKAKLEKKKIRMMQHLERVAVKVVEAKG